MGTSADLFGSNVKLLSLQNDPPQVPNEQELLAAVTAKVGPFADRGKLLYHIRISAGKVHWAVNSYFRSILLAPSPPREDFDSKPCHTWHQAAATEWCNAQSAAAVSASRPPAGAAASVQHQFVPPVPVRHGDDMAATCCCSIQQPHYQWEPKHRPAGCLNSAISADSHTHQTTTAAAAAACSSVGLDMLPSSALENVLCLLDLNSLICAASSCKTLYKAAQSERIWKQLFQQQWGSVMFPTNKYGTHRCSSSSGRTQPAANSNSSKHWPAGGTAAAAGVSRAATVTAGLPQQDLASAAASGSQPRSAATGVTSTNTGACISNGSSDASFISRWTGSSVSYSRADAAAAAGAVGLKAGRQSAAAGQSSSQHDKSSSCSIAGHACCCRGCTALPATAPAGSWRQQYKKQYTYQAVRKCPKCGAATVVPIVYGFPSAPLLAGMSQKRLLLGGDHLIESCHVWACSGCRSCYRYFPYGDIQLWLQDDEAQQRLDQARSAAGRSRSSAAAGGGGGVNGSVAAEVAHVEVDGDDVAGLPRYTYEL